MLNIVGMQKRFPTYVSLRVAAGAGEVVPALVVIVEIAIGTRGPYDLRHGIGQLAESRFTRQKLGPNPVALGNIASYFRCTDDAAMLIFHRRDGQRDIEQRAVFALADGFEVIHTFTTLQAAQDVRFFLQALGRNQNSDWLSDRLFSGIAEQTLSAVVPASNDAVEILADDGVVG